jgi:hypothetical protein
MSANNKELARTQLHLIYFKNLFCLGGGFAWEKEFRKEREKNELNTCEILKQKMTYLSL